MLRRISAAIEKPVNPYLSNLFMHTSIKKNTNQVEAPIVHVQDVKRLLEVGRLLASILTEEELKALQDEVMADPAYECRSSSENR